MTLENAIIFSLSSALLIGIALLGWLMPTDSAPWQMILMAGITIMFGAWVYRSDRRFDRDSKIANEQAKLYGDNHD